ncbi:MAG TPA: hypothetical protein VG892_13900, partial [Terriglobales bacterium]|nr:hypothetical protein [Terriglobales bacterium]
MLLEFKYGVPVKGFDRGLQDFYDRLLVGAAWRRLQVMFLRGRIHWLPVSFLFSFLLLAGQALAQTDIAGQWSRSYHDDYPERGDIYIGDYVNLPINDAGRMRADTWSAEKWAMIEHQCHPHAGDYG